MWSKAQALRATAFAMRRHWLSSSAPHPPPPRPPLPWLKSNLRNLIKPFLLRCHPDVQESEEDKKINLVAIQNLNSYVDIISDAIKTGRPPRQPAAASPEDISRQGHRIVPIDFIIHRQGPSGRRRKASETFSSRRQVELVVPALRNEDSAEGPALALLLHRAATRELAKLLRVADLPVPPAHQHGQLPFQDDVEADELLSRPHHLHSTDLSSSSNRYARYRANRDRFTSRINWAKYQDAYRAAVADMRADQATSGLVRNHAGRRRRLIAGILSRTDCSDPDMEMAEQLIAMRRLSLLLDEHFDTLQLEDLGAYWENCRLELSPERGFQFALGQDNSLKIRIPIDFTDEQLIRELDRNLWDFVDVVEDSTFAGIFPN